MNLKSLIGDYPIIEIKGNTNKEIRGITQDSRDVLERFLFICIKGFNVDGHHFINQAIKNGATCIIHEEKLDIETNENITYILVKDTTDFLAYISSKFYNNPWAKLFMIGITGTNGKTSTSYLIKNILYANNIKTGVIGTIGSCIDDSITKLENTTPDSLTIQYNLNKMVENNVNACIMEVSSHALDLKRVEYMNFDIGIYTNLSKDHLDYHITMENYFNSKLKLFYKTTKYNIINRDDKYSDEIINNLDKEVNLMTYGIDKEADVSASEIVYGIDCVKFKLNFMEESILLKVNIPGKFSVYNSLAAAACGFAMGLDKDKIKIGIENTLEIKGRFEVMDLGKKYTVIIDFAHTPDGLLNVLNTISIFRKGRIIVVFGAGGNRDKSKRPQMGKVVGDNSDLAIVTSDNPRFEEPYKIIDDILEGVKETKVKYKIIVDRKEAIEYALNIAQVDDIILLAGKGHETHTIIGNNKYPLDERQIVYDYIKDK